MAEEKIELAKLLFRNIYSWLGIYNERSRGETGEEEFRRLEDGLATQIVDLIRKIAEK